MTEQVEQILASSSRRAIDGATITMGLLDLRTDKDQLIELVHRLIDSCSSTSAGWLLPPVCGWLDAQPLDTVAAYARSHLAEHPGCRVATAVLEHHALRQPQVAAPLTAHIAYPEPVVREWWDRWPLRTDHPTWVMRAPGQPTAWVGGAAGLPCPRCHGPGEMLLRVNIPRGQHGLQSRGVVDFVWCPGCSPFTRATYAEVDTAGHATLMPLETMIDVELLAAPDPFPRTEVGLVDVGPEWRRQSWMWSNNIENLHRIGGEPTWIQHEHIPPCRRCRQATDFVGQIAVSDLAFGEGITYLFWCDNCSVTAVVYQQT